MNKNLMAFNIFFVAVGLTSIGCLIGNNQLQNQPPTRILKIEIVDRTYLHYYKNGQNVRDKIIKDPDQIKAFQGELDSMKEVQNMNIKYNMGYYEIILDFKDGTREEAGLIYTIYDGVVFHDVNTNKTFKNNEMEELVRTYFNE